MSEATQFSLFKRSNGFWYILYVEDGRKRWKSTNASLKTDALKSLSHFRELFKTRDAYKSFSSFEADYLAYSASIHTKGTQEGYKYAFQDFREILGDISLHQVTVRHVEKILAEKTATVSEWRARGVYICLRSAFQTAIRWKLITENPFAKVAKPKTKEINPVYLSSEDFPALINAIRDQDFRELVITALLTGMRLSELASLEWSDIDFARKVAFVQNKKAFTTKSKGNRIIPISDTLLPVLSNRLSKAKSETPFVFHLNGAMLTKNYISKTFKKYVKLTTLDQRLHFHSLRHSFASNLVKSGASLYEVQKLLGHSSSSTTQIYSHLQPEQLHNTVNRLKFELVSTQN
jgi:site-specific recombinase XerD